MHYKRLISIIAAITLSAAIPASVMAATSKEIQKEIDSYQSELEESQETSASLEIQIAEAQAQAGAVTA